MPAVETRSIHGRTEMTALPRFHCQEERIDLCLRSLLHSLKLKRDCFAGEKGDTRVVNATGELKKTACKPAGLQSGVLYLLIEKLQCRVDSMDIQPAKDLCNMIVRSNTKWMALQEN